MSGTSFSVFPLVFFRTLASYLSSSVFGTEGERHTERIEGATYLKTSV